MKKLFTAAAVIITVTMMTASVQANMTTPRSLDYAVAMGMGWNLGNSLDGMGGSNLQGWETSWGNPIVTQALVSSIKERGFDHIRIPFTIDNRGTDRGAATPASEIRWVIDAGWMARYKEVVQWALDADLYVMINIHHDSWYWLGRAHGQNPMGAPWNGQTDQPHYRRFTDYWKQLAELFADMPDAVMFETINEPEFNDNGGDPSAENQRRLDVINKAAFDIIRATPGNETRMIIIPTWKTNHEAVHSQLTSNFILGLNDENIIATVHYYSEWVFSNPLGRTRFDEELFQQGGPGTDTRTARSSADAFYDILQTHFISKGIGVSVGEWGLLGYDHDRNGFSMQRGEELKYYEYMMHKARNAQGVSLSFWDNGSGIDRRSANLEWIVPQMGEMLLTRARTSYSTGLNTLYFPHTGAQTDADIALTLNGNTFTGIAGLTRDVDYTYNPGNSTVTLKTEYINGKLTSAMSAGQYGTFDTLIMQFSAGLEWHQYLVKNGTPVFSSATGTRSGGITIPADFKGNWVRSVTAFRGAAPAVITGIRGSTWTASAPWEDGFRVGGNHTGWWPFLEYGAAYTTSYTNNNLILRSGFFNNTVQDGLNTVVVEFQDGSRVDIPLTVSGSAVTVGNSSILPSNRIAAGAPRPMLVRQGRILRSNAPIRLYSVSGKLVAESSAVTGANNNAVTLNMSRVPNGFYIAKSGTENLRVRWQR
ncbi:MAG: cellulase family glycosylhydrolase [Chitinispirillia bacterium]|nr:cellulase family glycosylhydrolase [Chitinispirillia bacterium]